MRKMATVRRIDNIMPIQNAETIQCATVGGWNVVIKKGDFNMGDLAIYCEIDSWIPHEIAPFLSKNQEPKEYNGVKGEKLRTIKLRGQISQGLLLPFSVCMSRLKGAPVSKYFIENTDVSEILNIQKWEAPIHAQLAGEVRGTFPSFIPKTDQERIQNLTDDLNSWRTQELTFEVTEKLDGSSMTVYSYNGDKGVCSRNLNLKESDTNSFWNVCKRERLLDKISNLNVALQGELIGEGIQGNPYNIKGQHFYLFDIFDIDKQRYYTPDERTRFCYFNNIKHVPILEVKKNISHYVVDDIIEFADAKSHLYEVQREGVVFKCNENSFIHFKSISNKFLLKNDK